MKKVLFVAYPFPPTGGAPVRRTLKFLKTLPSFGWSAAVLTVKEELARHPDPDLLNQIPSYVKVFRTSSLGYFFKKEELSALRRQGSPKRSLFRSLTRMLKGSVGLFAIPEAYILWAPNALLGARRLIQEFRPQLLYSTAPPFTDHLVAALLKTLTGLPLVVDFRDAWIAEPAKIWRSRFRKLMEEKLEAFVVCKADAVISTSEGVTHDFQRRYKGLDSSKFVTIPNGYDREEFEWIKEIPEKKKAFRIVHTGILRLERNPKGFLRAVSELLEERPRYRSLLEIVFVGDSLKFSDGCFIEDYIEGFDLRDVVSLTGFVSRSLSLAYQKSADLLLLIVGKVPQHKTETYGIAGKVYDYMAAGKPVLALAQKGPVQRLIEETGIGAVADPEDVTSIKGALIGFLEGKSFCFNPRPQAIAKYDFKRLTERLVHVFEDCIRKQARA